MEIREAKFEIDTLGDEVFDGYTSGESWNGWACPLFTFDQAERIVEAFRARGWDASYDESTDQFVFSIEHDSLDEKDSYPPVNVNGRKFYPVGAFCWIWEERAEKR